MIQNKIEVKQINMDFLRFYIYIRAYFCCSHNPHHQNNFGIHCFYSTKTPMIFPRRHILPDRYYSHFQNHVCSNECPTWMHMDIPLDIGYLQNITIITDVPDYRHFITYYITWEKIKSNFQFYLYNAFHHCYLHNYLHHYMLSPHVYICDYHMNTHVPGKSNLQIIYNRSVKRCIVLGFISHTAYINDDVFN